MEDEDLFIELASKVVQRKAVHAMYQMTLADYCSYALILFDCHSPRSSNIHGSPSTLLFLAAPFIDFHLCRRHCMRCNLVFLCCYFAGFIFSPLVSIHCGTLLASDTEVASITRAKVSFSLFRLISRRRFCKQDPNIANGFFVCSAAAAMPPPFDGSSQGGCLPSRRTQPISYTTSTLGTLVQIVVVIIIHCCTPLLFSHDGASTTRDRR